MRPAPHPELDILDTTLRDGSYVTDFQFTAADTAWMARELEAAGIDWIEIGHGLGFNASVHYKTAAATDAEYIRAARGALTRAKFGMFCIPGIARVDDLDMAADLGMDFVRIGANVDRTEQMAPFIARARKLGMYVCTNFMKSYTMPPSDFGQVARMAEGFGSQMNYLVDSAGGMMPEDVRAYFDQMAQATTIPYGFHGHDNTRLATANSLVAAECGAHLIDTTLFGVGRGSGNAATELMVPLLQRRYGVFSRIDTNRLIRLAETQAVPLTYHRRQETISLSLGLAQVHSMFLSKIAARANEEAIDIHDLISEVGAISKIDATDAVIDSAVANVRARAPRAPLQPGGFFELPEQAEPVAAIAQAESVADKLALPCRVWVAAGPKGARARIVRLPDAVEVRMTGDAAVAVAAVRRPTTQIYLAPNLADLAASLRRGSGPSVTVADAMPAWAKV